MVNSSVTASFNSTFAVILRRLLDRSPRTGEKTTYKALAEYLDVKQQSVSSWANGTTVPDTKHIAPIADYFDVSCDYLLGHDDAPNHVTSDVCKVIPLASETVEVLKLYKAATFGREFSDLPISANELGIKALDHIVSNCNELLTHIGIYLFGSIIGTGNVRLENAAINLLQPDEFIRNGILQAIIYTLKNYRTKLIENGGDLPLTAVLDETRQDREESAIKLRVEYLEALWQRKLTDDEIRQQREQLSSAKLPSESKIKGKGGPDNGKCHKADE